MNTQPNLKQWSLAATDIPTIVLTIAHCIFLLELDQSSVDCNSDWLTSLEKIPYQFLFNKRTKRRLLSNYLSCHRSDIPETIIDPKRKKVLDVPKLQMLSN